MGDSEEAEERGERGEERRGREGGRDRVRPLPQKEKSWRL
jgi:hypothetical protein